MKYTANYNLKKPEGTDTVNIDDFNNNADILDTEINSINEQINNLNANKADLVDGKLPSEQLPTINVPVQSVNNKTGAVVLTKADIGLGNVDNTVDSAKAVLSATKLQTARNINGVAFDGTAPITITDGTKAPIAHASANNLYGLGTDGVYGHVKLINNLTQSSYIDGNALSSYQGKLLNDKLYYQLKKTFTIPVPIAIVPSSATILDMTSVLSDVDNLIFVLRGSLTFTNSRSGSNLIRIGYSDGNSSVPKIVVLTYTIPGSSSVTFSSLNIVTKGEVNDYIYNTTSSPKNITLWSSSTMEEFTPARFKVYAYYDYDAYISCSGSLYLDVYAKPKLR